MRKHYIVNQNTKTFVVTNTESFDGDWKENYQHTRGADWLDVNAYAVWDHDKTSNGMYFVYDLCCDGGSFCLIAEADRHTPEMIRAAKGEIRHNHDVVSLRVLRLRPQ
jgi:hypothetical protein